MATILIAEDDKNLQLLLQARLKTHYQVICADDGKAALEVIESGEVDLLVADVNMPKIDGFQLVKAIRDRGLEMPVLLLTARQSLGDKREGFSSGTDDYVTKPVDFEELSLRIQALLRRSKISQSQRVTAGKTVVDSVSYTIDNGSLRLELPKKEFDLLFKLLSYPDRIFTKQELLDAVWGSQSESGEETVKTHISRLRGRLEPFVDIELITLKGLGYKAQVIGSRR